MEDGIESFSGWISDGQALSVPRDVQVININKNLTPETRAWRGDYSLRHPDSMELASAGNLLTQIPKLSNRTRARCRARARSAGLLRRDKARIFPHHFDLLA
jgi:hypothetical protein